MTLDNVSFLIMWFLVMFVTLASGILVIMYRVGCFKCTKKIGIGDLQAVVEQMIKKQPAPAEPEQEQQPENPSENEKSSRNIPDKLCVVCGEPLGPEDDTSENTENSSHAACKDMDASFL